DLFGHFASSVRLRMLQQYSHAARPRTRQEEGELRMRPLRFLALVAVVAAGCAQVQGPDPRVAAVADRLAIDQLVAGDYPRALDARNWDAYVATFTDDGELVLGENRTKGHDAIKGFLGTLPAEPKVIHVISNLSY